ncbi:WecB/TagA/CpsF family glycosyltransferase [Candidatus Falkowbacteria bacterium]|nr:WecB/TagA/CpsF family glycosyltransferase [Candidatus Falkowbacteria bacterium]
MKVDILGLHINQISWPETFDVVKNFLTDGRQHTLVTLNPEMVVLARHDPEYKTILNQADITIPDGIGLIFASWFLGKGKLRQRLPGVDLSWKIAELAAASGQTLYLLGGQNGVGQRAAAEMQRHFPRLMVYSGGDNLHSDDPQIITDIQNKQPTILLVAFGQRAQEFWIAKNISRLPSVRIALGVGGTFDFISGQVKRAPRAFRSLGLEWFWRLLMQPWRIGRIINATCRFSYLVVQSRLLGK